MNATVENWMNQWLVGASSLKLVPNDMDIGEALDMLTAAQNECEEQARLLGQSGSREAALLAKIDRLQNVLAAAEKAVETIHSNECPVHDADYSRCHEDCKALTKSIAAAKLP